MGHDPSPEQVIACAVYKLRTPQNAYQAGCKKRHAAQPLLFLCSIHIEDRCSQHKKAEDHLLSGQIKKKCQKGAAKQSFSGMMKNKFHQKSKEKKVS